MASNFTGKELYQVLIALADEAGSKLSNFVRPDADMIKAALEHEWFDPGVTESYAEEVGSNSIIVLVINGDQYRAICSED